MHKALFTLFLILIFASLSSAQTAAPRWELLGGFTEYDAGGEFAPSLPNGEPGGEPGQLATQGFQVGLARSFKNYFRMRADFIGVFGKQALSVEHLPPGGEYKTGSQFIGLFGPEAVLRKQKHFDFFTHYLIGFSHATDNQLPAVLNNTHTTWLYGIGFGIDLKTGHRLAIRLIDADWITSHFPKQDLNAQDNWRYTTGVVYRFGQ
jgi:hypothetical protein